MRGACNFLGSNRYHLERRIGTTDEAINYCTKQDTRIHGTEIYEKGERPVGQGARSDIATLAGAVLSGTSLRAIARENPMGFIRYHRGVERLIEVIRPPIERPAPDVLIYWGPTGTGKSRLVRESYPPETTYWWPRPSHRNAAPYAYGLTPEKTTIVFDDFYSWIPYDLVLRICDRNPLQVNRSGAGTALGPITTVVFTSNADPRTWWPGVRLYDADLSAFFRRVTRVIHMSGETTPNPI